MILTIKRLEALNRSEAAMVFPLPPPLPPQPYHNVHIPFTSFNINRTTPAPIAIKRQPAQITKRSSQNLFNVFENVEKLCREGRLKESVGIMKEQCIPMDTHIFFALLHACANRKAMPEGKQVHAHILKTGLDQDVFLGTKLVNMYAIWGIVADARLVFDNILIRNVFLWNAIISAYVRNGLCDEALVLYYQMHLSCVKPGNFTYSCVLKACAIKSALQQGKQIHSHIIRNGFDSDVFVENALVAMYAKCGIIERARQVFDKMSFTDVVSWNSMIAGYSKYGKIEIARHLFDKMPQRDVVSWNTMIAGYAQNEHANEALTLLRQMQLAGVKPDPTTMVSVLPSCAQIAALQLGMESHGYIIRSAFNEDIFVENALVAMYAKCGSIEFARKAFDKMLQKNLVSWNAIIAGYGMHGHGEDALTLFSQMKQAGLKPDYITFVAILSACSHAGLVAEGCKYFNCMTRDYDVRPGVDHYTCMVDLLGRAGHLEEAHNLIKNMLVEPDAGLWGALLGACRIHCNTVLGEYAAGRLLELEPENAGNYILLSNIYAAAGRWYDVTKSLNRLTAENFSEYKHITMQSGEEDDYMGDLSQFLQPHDLDTPKPIGKQGGDKGRKRKLNWKDRKKNKREEQQKEEDQQIAKGFNSAIPSTNIGFKMLQQMGYNPGVALGKHGQGRLEPVSLEIKRSRAGLGRDHVEKEEKERRAQEMEKIIQNKKRKEGNLMSEYGERQKILWQTRKIVVNYKKASAALAQLEEANSKPDSDIEKEKGLKEETEETEDNEEEEEVTAEDLQAVLDRLRTEFHYCLYCGCQYESADAMLSHCPGVEEEDH